MLTSAHLSACRMLDQLAELAVIGAGSGRTSLADVLQACEIVRRALGAEEAYVIQATDPDFTKLGSAEAYLTKPFTKQALTAAVERWAELPR